MEAPRLERRLVAILAADVEGYSRHMEQDEVATLATLSSLRSTVDALISQHKGRITNTAGDSVLAEFISVVDALDCADRIQQDLAAANETRPPDRRLQFRIGINVGDVMVKDGDIFGDGVNIAARLETLALPGGICVSRGVRDHVRKMGKYVFEDLGEQSVKNIAEPIRAFRLRSGAAETAEPSPSTPSVQPPAPEPPAPAAFELTFWESIEGSKDPAEFAAYLRQYPQGTFIELADARRNALLAEQAAPPAVSSEIAEIEMAFWDTVKTSDDPAMFAAYLEKYPDGSFAALAKVQLDKLTQPD